MAAFFLFPSISYQQMAGNKAAAGNKTNNKKAVNESIITIHIFSTAANSLI